ncbi:MAG: thioredoxin [Oscillospiraceae bacterium]|jgi:thioredoxin 1|nr:thioredoxin [Oscillospiraceae bacterium]
MMVSEYIIEVTQDNFDANVMQAEKPILLDFWAPWCGPCRMVSPQLELLSKEMNGELVVGKINVDEQGELAQRFGVMSIPTLVLIKGGRVVDTMVGAASKNEIKKLVTEGLAAVESSVARQK